MTATSSDTRPLSRWCVASLACGIAGLLGGFLLAGVPCIAAIAAGHIGLRRSREEGLRGRRAAIAGLALGYAVMVPLAFYIVLAFPHWRAW